MPRVLPHLILVPVAGLTALLLVVSLARAQQRSGPEALQALWQQAIALQDKGAYAEALKRFEEALAMASSIHPEHLTTAALMNDTANVYADLAQYTKAEQLYRRSLAIREAQLGKNHLDVAESLRSLAIL